MSKPKQITMRRCATCGVEFARNIHQRQPNCYACIYKASNGHPLARHRHTPAELAAIVATLEDRVADETRMPWERRYSKG